MSTTTHTTKSPRQLYSMAKTLGIWDPAKIDLTEDKGHWQMLNAEQREQLIKVCALFYEGEVSVSDTLAWFMLAVPELERRMFLSTQIFEEVKHAEFFERYFQEVCGAVDTTAYLVPEYRGVLLDELRQRGEAIGSALTSGRNGDLALSLTLFAAHYMGVVEGVMALTGYEFFEDLLAKTGMFPRLLEGSSSSAPTKAATWYTAWTTCANNWRSIPNSLRRFENYSCVKPPTSLDAATSFLLPIRWGWIETAYRRSHITITSSVCAKRD